MIQRQAHACMLTSFLLSQQQFEYMVDSQDLPVLSEVDVAIQRQSVRVYVCVCLCMFAYTYYVFMCVSVRSCTNIHRHLAYIHSYFLQV